MSGIKLMGRKCDSCGGKTDTPLDTEDRRLLCPDCYFDECTMDDQYDLLREKGTTMSDDYAEVFQELVDLLNDLMEKDPNAMNALIELGVPINKEVEEHPKARCTGRPGSDQVVLRMLGILNGLTQPHGYAITADYEENAEGQCGDLTGFSLRRWDNENDKAISENTGGENA